MHKQLINWEIAANTQNENIVRDYKKKLNLFILTAPTSTRALINDTPLPTAKQVASIIKSTQYTQPDIYKDRFHHYFHNSTIFHLRFSICQYCFFQNGNFTNCLQMSLENMIWCQIARASRSC